jgi:hypothetical protein
VNQAQARSGPLERTRAEIAYAERVAAFRRTRISRARLRVRQSDALLDLVEECRTRDFRLIPHSLWGAVVRAVGQVDPELRDELGINRDPEHVADVLFAAQERLLEHVRVSQRTELAPIIPLFGERVRASASR